MLEALRVTGRGILQFERFGWRYIAANILAAVLSLPIITLPVAFAGLSRMSYVAQTSHTTAISDFWAGFRTSLRRGLLIGIANVVVFGILVVNFWSYREQNGLFFILLRTIWTIILIGWMAVQLYLWPILDAMETPTLLGGLRNAALMVSLNPFFSLTLLAIVLMIAVISTLVAALWLLISVSLIACMANAAVLDRLPRRGKQVNQEPSQTNQ